ncbi:MAG: bifunctional 4-hydroxy-2-oxoglutarate aldolase/2-dehydro-3-deoxy-phosphogluconate aldolase [Gammaproteobacteria bacterium]|nr:bifunctional 4-hydroxy-2-oxoglutarate aldolase/2-dehydro-3-deoxy-phosphogluconate aldolase [Gammaproteobacteria bacterium]
MLDILSRSKVIPVIRIDDIQSALPLAESLIDGGLNVLEITLRTPVALDAIKQIKERFPLVSVGAGTVISPLDMQQATEAGADFCVSPGSTTPLIEYATSLKCNWLPGVATPSEMMNLFESGFLYQKLFPADAVGGVKLLKSVAGPLPQIQFCPTGGINENSASDYLELNNVVCVGGSWMLPAESIEARNWPEIMRLAKIASQL